MEAVGDLINSMCSVKCWVSSSLSKALFAFDAIVADDDPPSGGFWLVIACKTVAHYITCFKLATCLKHNFMELNPSHGATLHATQLHRGDSTLIENRNGLRKSLQTWIIIQNKHNFTKHEFWHTSCIHLVSNISGFLEDSLSMLIYGSIRHMQNGEKIACSLCSNKNNRNCLPLLCRRCI